MGFMTVLATHNILLQPDDHSFKFQVSDLLRVYVYRVYVYIIHIESKDKCLALCI